MATGADRGADVAPERVRERVIGLPRRFRVDSSNGLQAEWELELGPQTFTISVSDHTCVVRDGASQSPHARIWAEPATWLAMDEGRITGIEAFYQQRLRVGGNVDLAVRVQTLFRPYRRARRPTDLDQLEVRAGGLRLSCYAAGEGRPLVLLHGLGGSKISWLPVLDALARRFRVIAPDLPGHGESDKPATDYTPRFYAGVTRQLMDELGLERAVMLGNSMGGRAALEVAVRSPSRVSALALLGPAMPGLRWRYLMALTRIVPTEFGRIPFPLRERWMRGMVRRMFARPQDMSGETFSVAAEEFIRVYRSPAARMAFFSTLRHLVTERPGPFWTTMRRVKQPVLVLFGEEDRLVPPSLGSRLAESLPNATFRSLPAVGHVPQVEAPDEVLDAILTFVAEEGLTADRR